DILPLPMYHMCDHLKVVFVGQGQPSEKQLKKVLRIRKRNVAAALSWLMEHNVIYKNITLDEAILDSLPEDAVPDALRVTIVMVDIDPKQIEHYTGYLTNPPNSDDTSHLEDQSGDESDSSDEGEFGSGKGKFSFVAQFDPICGTSELRSSGLVYTDSV